MSVGQAAQGSSHVTGLTTRDLEILAFERQWWKFPGSKETAINELFGVSATRYFQMLNALLDSPAALAADPMLVKRLRRTRTSRSRGREDDRTLGASQG